jgi:catechol 2,3-dioxygenase-like lactoylglutathione lyase family enzyme
MIHGAHAIIFSTNADADRKFFRDVLKLRFADAGHGWLIFALPPAEAAFHPGETNGAHELYLLCTDLKAEMQALTEKGVECSAVHEERWGSITRFKLPGGGAVGLYQPKHKLAI